MSGDFTPEQKRYLEGFASGLHAGRAARGVPAGSTPDAEPIGPDAAAFKAQDRVLKEGKKLSDQEKFKREEHPFDAYARLKAQAEKNEAPKPADNFRWRYFGLFYVAPAQNSYMCRLRMPNGILTHWQLTGLADLAERYGGGYSHVTTRANLQIREIEPKNAVAMVEAIQDLGLCLARLRRRQHPQRHRHADRRHRSARADRHAAVCARMALPHPQRARALRPTAQVQRGVRRRRHDSGAGGYQRHRVRGGRGRGRPWRRAGHLVQASGSAASRGIAISRARPAWWSSRRKRRRSQTPSCASSSTTAIAPTATRRGSNTCSMRSASTSS